MSLYDSTEFNAKPNMSSFDGNNNLMDFDGFGYASPKAMVPVKSLTPELPNLAAGSGAQRRRGRPCASERYNNELMERQFQSLLNGSSSMYVDDEFAKTTVMPFIAKRQRRVRANDRERNRMQSLNEALEVLKQHLPEELLASFKAQQQQQQQQADDDQMSSSASTTSSSAKDRRGKPDFKITKIDTLKLASEYILLLTNLLEDYEKNSSKSTGSTSASMSYSSASPSISSSSPSPLCQYMPYQARNEPSSSREIETRTRKLRRVEREPPPRPSTEPGVDFTARTTDSYDVNHMHLAEPINKDQQQLQSQFNRCYYATPLQGHENYRLNYHDPYQQTMHYQSTPQQLAGIQMLDHQSKDYMFCARDYYSVPSAPNSEAVFYNYHSFNTVSQQPLPRARVSAQFMK